MVHRDTTILMPTGDVFEDDADDLLDDPQPEPLVDWAKPPSIEDLKADFDGARPHHDAHMAKIHKWNDLLNVTGSSKPKKVAGRSAVQPKLIKRQAEWRYSALTEPFLGSDKLFDCKPRTFEDKPYAIQNEILLNWQMDSKIDKVKFIDDYIRAAVDEGTVIVRTGWHRSYTTELVPVPVYNIMPLTSPEQAQILEQAIAMKAENPTGFLNEADPALVESVKFYEETQQMGWAELVGEEFREEEVVDENHPTAEVLNPENVFIDPSCQGDIDKAKFAIISFETSQADLRAQGDLYKNLDQVDWESLSIITETTHKSSTPTDFNFKDVMRKRIVAYEYWGYYDIHDRGTLVPIVATWVGNTLIRLEENPYPDRKIPLVIANYLPVKRELFGEPDAEFLEDNQKVLGAVLRGAIDLMGRSANGQQGFPKGFLDPLNKRRHAAGEDFEYNPVQGTPDALIYQGKFPELSQSTLLMMQLMNQEAESMTGVKSFSGGISGNAYGDVAAGIRGTLDAASKREMGILRRMAKGVTGVGIKWASMNAVFLTEEETVRVTNEQFVTIRKEDLKGKFDLITDISTAEIDDAKAQDLGFMLQTMGPNMDFSMVKLILVEIARLKRMPDLAKSIEKYEPQPDPLVERMKELEIAEKEALIEKIRSETIKNQALTDKAEAEATLTAIDAVEQETGTKHEREMDKMMAQSEGNAAHEIMKSLVKPTKEGEKAPNVEAAIGFQALNSRARTAGLV